MVIDLDAADWRASRQVQHDRDNAGRQFLPADAAVCGIAIRAGAQIGNEFGFSRIQYRLCQRETAAAGHVLDPTDGYLAVEQGQDRGGEKDDDEARH